MESNRENRLADWVDDRLACIVPPASWEPDTAKGLDRFRQGRRRRKGLTWAWAAAATVTVCASALMFPATRVVAERCVNACLGTNRPVSRKLAPDFMLPDATGKPVRLSDFRGKVVLLNFWATWCAPCNIEMPWLVEFQREYRDAGLVVVGVATDYEGWNLVRPYLDEKRLNYRVVLGDDNITHSYGDVEALPTTFLIDRSGRIAATYIGLPDKYSYSAIIRDLIAER